MPSNRAQPPISMSSAIRTRASRKLAFAPDRAARFDECHDRLSMVRRAAVPFSDVDAFRLECFVGGDSRRPQSELCLGRFDGHSPRDVSSSQDSGSLARLGE
jgi:hypothetical protein